MIAVDTNILIYAHRQESPEHAAALKWLTCLAEGPLPWAIPVFCLGEFIRVVTHPRIFDPPTRLGTAVAVLSGLLESPSMRVLNPGSGYCTLYYKRLLEADARGNLAFDAQIAAVCSEHGVSALLTADRDFARFANLKLLGLSDAPACALRASGRWVTA